MPYKSTRDLPKQVSDNLPEHAQHIYKEAYNSALKEYKNPTKRRGSSGHEQVAAKVAWSAVKQKYHKEKGKWMKD